MIPKTTTHYLPMKDGETPQMYYRVRPVTFNDGIDRLALEYYSSFNTWQGSDERDSEKFIKERLIKL